MYQTHRFCILGGFAMCQTQKCELWKVLACSHHKKCESHTYIYIYIASGINLNCVNIKRVLKTCNYFIIQYNKCYICCLQDKSASCQTQLNLAIINVYVS